MLPTAWGKTVGTAPCACPAWISRKSTSHSPMRLATFIQVALEQPTRRGSHPQGSSPHAREQATHKGAAHTQGRRPPTRGQPTHQGAAHPGRPAARGGPTIRGSTQMALGAILAPYIVGPPLAAGLPGWPARVACTAAPMSSLVGPPLAGGLHGWPARVACLLRLACTGGGLGT